MIPISFGTIEMATPVGPPPQPASSLTPAGPPPEEIQSPSRRKRRKFSLILAWVLASVFFLTTTAATLVAVHQNSIANAWHREYQQAEVRLAAAHASIASLTSQIGNLNTQLAAQSTAKEKALDQNSVLTGLVSQEATVSTELNSCVSDLRTFIGSVGDYLNSGYLDPNLTYESDNASATCNQAQSANQALQSALSGATG